MNDAELHAKAAGKFGEWVSQIAEDQWTSPTPCTEWDVRALVRHIVYEQLWIPPLMDGQTVEQVGDRFDGDILGSDPKAAWERSVAEAIAAFGEPDALERTVHLTGRDVPGAQYAAECWTDLTVHGWDLAKGIGASEAMDPDLVDRTYVIMKPMIDQWRSSGVFGDDVPVDAEADPQTRLLALYGRRADWKP